jgi:hypothetical protein
MVCDVGVITRTFETKLSKQKIVWDLQKHKFNYNAPFFLKVWIAMSDNIAKVTSNFLYKNYFPFYNYQKMGWIVKQT